MTDHSLIPTSRGDDAPPPSPALRTIRVIAPPGEPVEGLGAGDSRYLPGLVEPGELDAMLAALMPGGEVAYQQWYHMPDQKKPHRALRPLRRIKAAMATAPEEGLTPHYRFPVNDQDRHGVHAPMTPTVNALRERVEARLGERFNHAVILVYRDGDDAIGFHKDKLLDLDPEAPIASISLGAQRPLVLRDDIFEPGVEHEVLLASGSLFVLGPRTNKNFYHSIPRRPTDEIDRPRVSLTFRRTLTFRDAAGRVYGQGEAYQTLNWPTELRGRHRLQDED